MAHIEGFDTFTNADQASTPYPEACLLPPNVHMVGGGGFEPPMFLRQGFTDPCPRQLGIPSEIYNSTLYL